MTDDELRLWNEERLRLFAGAKIPPHALAAILHDARRLDFDRAMRALTIYRAAKPYRGFYAVDWARHYDMTRPTAAGRTDGAAARAAAASEAERNERERVEADKRREIERYMSLPETVRAAARAQLGHLGWPMSDESRGWRMVVLKWHAGEDVSNLNHPSKLCRSLPEKPRGEISDAELARELRALIQGCEMRLKTLRGAA